LPEKRTLIGASMDGLIEYTGSLPDRKFVKHRLSGFQGEILRLPHSPDSPLLTVIIPTRDAYGKGCFPRLLEQLQRQTVWNQAELFVIKGDSRQGRAINIGSDLAKGKYILTLDDDEILCDDNVLEILLQVMEENDDIGMAGGQNMIPPDATSFVRRTMEQIPRRSTPPIGAVTESDMAEHGLLMMRTEVFTHVGGENELIPRGLDPYLRQEFRKAGFRVVVVPGANYSHVPPATLSKLLKQFFRNGKQAAFCNKFYPQWVIETPESHVKTFIEKRPFLYRVARFIVNIVRKTLRRHWIYLTVSFVYALGYMWGYLSCGDNTKT
jgi:glycosyltransferase involved in cell wall biosynthesis